MSLLSNPRIKENEAEAIQTRVKRLLSCRDHQTRLCACNLLQHHYDFNNDSLTAAPFCDLTVPDFDGDFFFDAEGL